MGAQRPHLSEGNIGIDGPSIEADIPIYILFQDRISVSSQPSVDVNKIPSSPEAVDQFIATSNDLASCGGLLFKTWER